MLESKQGIQTSAVRTKGTGVVFGHRVCRVETQPVENDSRSFLSAVSGNPLFWWPVTWCLIIGTVYGGEACVHFDVAETVACRTLSIDSSTRQVGNGEMLIEASFDVSSLIRLGSEDDLLQYLYVIESPERTVRVVDYTPKNQLAPLLASNVDVSQQTEKSASLGFNANGTTGAVLNASANASGGSKAATSTQFELLAPMHLLASSGTASRGAAVYFKLKPSRQTSLDGARQFTVVFRVPRNWRADYVRLRCAAFGRNVAGARGHHPRPVCGSAEFLVGLYLEGDSRAKEAARELARSERRLRSVASQQHRRIERRRYASAGDKLAALLNLAEPQIPEQWLQQVLRGDSSQRSYDFDRHLPNEVRQAVQDFCDARSHLFQLGQPREELARAL